MIFVPADSKNVSSVEMVTIDPHDLQEAQDRDRQPNPARRTNPTGYDPPERLRSCGLCARRSATIGDAPVTVLNVRYTTIYRCNHPLAL